MSTVEEIREAYTAEIDFHLTAVSPPTRSLLRELAEHEHFAGSTDPPALGVLLSIVRGVQPSVMLELGTHLGSRPWRLQTSSSTTTCEASSSTVDPNLEAQEVATQFLARARLKHRVRFVSGYSTEPDVAETLQQAGPFSLAYVDSSHSYGGTLQELELLFGREGWLVDAGVLVAHDAAPEAAAFDPTQAGGVSRALAEWVAARPDAYELFVLQPPLWPCGCGLGLLRRR